MVWGIAMPLLLGYPLWVWLAGATVGGAAGAAARHTLDSPETVNHFNNVSPDEVSRIIEQTQPKTLGDGLVSVGAGLTVLAVVASLYLLKGK